tara:strand:- start:360 stop:509 length:150 start_codon:yes stop_codon:yes gene_type:complete
MDNNSIKIYNTATLAEVISQFWINGIAFDAEEISDDGKTVSHWEITLRK